eukprot:7187551-Pyramimonas_sp.AAC.1
MQARARAHVAHRSRSHARLAQTWPPRCRMRRGGAGARAHTCAFSLRVSWRRAEGISPTEREVQRGQAA